MKQKYPRTAKQTFVHRMRTTVRGYMLRGLIVLVPIGITAYALILCYQLTAAHLAPFIQRWAVPMPDYAVVLLSVALFFALLYSIGLVATAVVGRQFIGLGEAILRRIPLVKTVYAASKQVMDVLQPKDAEPAYQEAVLVDFPAPGIKSIAFVTGHIELEGLGPHYRVFVPTTPNPTSGYFEILPPRHVQQTDMSVETAVKAAMSAGILVPEQIDTQSTVAATPSVRDSVESPAPASAGTKRVSLWQFTKNIFRRRILSGFLVLVPLAVTAFVVKFVYDFTAGRIAPFTRVLLEPLHDYVPASVTPVIAPVVSILLMLATLYVTGYIATAVVGGRIIRLAEAVLHRIPLITTVYGASKQIAETLLLKGGTSFKEAVIVEFPFPGAMTAGFLVGEVRTSDGQLYYKVFVPTTPNITVGLLEFFAPEHTFACPLSVEETIKMVVSGGLIAPDSMVLRPISEAARGSEPSETA